MHALHSHNPPVRCRRGAPGCTGLHASAACVVCMQSIGLEPLRDIVDAYNGMEGFEANGDESPFSVARRQPQHDAQLVYGCAVDKICEELRDLRLHIVPSDEFTAFRGTGGHSEWQMVRPCPTARVRQACGVSRERA